MSDDIIIALVLCGLGAAAIVLALIVTLKQKIYYDPENNAITNIEVPFLGKLKTNSPAIGLSFLGVIFGYFAYDLTKTRAPTLVNFDGEITLDEIHQNKVRFVMVGVTSGAWIQNATPSGTPPKIRVSIPVPNSWSTYTAYAFATDGNKTYPAIIGTSLENPEFKLRISQ